MGKQTDIENTETTTVTLVVASRPYPIRTLAKDEALVHQLANEINEKINAYQAQFPGRDKQDLLAMVLLASHMDWAKTRFVAAPDEKTVQRLKSIDDMLTRMI